MNNLRTIRFLRSCFTPPYPTIPVGKNLAKEVVFSGRSNVGKSSLINYLTESKGIAKTSSTPGKTQAVNFFLVDEKLLLVDLPGYGFAKSSREKQTRWNVSTERYLQTSPNIAVIIQLLDVRHRPTDEDLQMIDWAVQSRHKMVLVLTKIDKIPSTKQQHVIARFIEAFSFLVIPCTIKTPVAKQQLIQIIREYTS